MIFFKKVLTFILVLMFYQQDILMMQQEITYGKINKLIEKLKKDRIDKSNYKDVVGIIIQGMENKRGMREDVSKFFDKLIKKDQGAVAVIFVAVRFIEDGNWECAFQLFNKLVEKNQGFKDAANAVMMALGEQNWDVREKAFDLLLKLLDRGEGFREAIEILESDLHIKDYDALLCLSNKLIQMDQGIEAVISLVFKYFNKGYENLAFLLLDKLLEKDYGVGCAIELARKSVRNKNRDYCDDGLIIFCKLVEKGFALKDAKRAAKKCVKNKSSFIRSKALDLFGELVKKDLALKKALRAAKRCIKSKDSNVRSSAILLFSELVKKGTVFKKVIAIAKIGIKDECIFVRYSAQILFDELFKKKLVQEEDALEYARMFVEQKRWDDAFYFFGLFVENDLVLDEAIEIVKSEIQNGNREIISSSLLKFFNKLLEKNKRLKDASEFLFAFAEKSCLFDDSPFWISLDKLFERGHGFQEAIKFVFNNIECDSRKSFKLFDKLFQNGQGFEEAIESALVLLHSNNYYYYEEGLILFDKLFEKGQGFEEAIKIATVFFNDSSKERRAIELFSKLFKKTQGVEQAIELIRIAFETDGNWPYALKLVDKLFKNGQGFEQIIELVKILFNNEDRIYTGIKNYDKFIRRYSLKLLGKLVEHDQAFELAKQFATRAFEREKYETFHILVDVLNLLGKLVKKNQAFEIAKDLAIRAFKENEDMYVRAAALKLLGKLVEKDFAFEQALDVAIKGVNDGYIPVIDTAFKLLKKIYEKEEYKNIEISISENVIGKVHKSFIKSKSVTIRDLLEDLDEVAVVDLYPFFEKYIGNVEISFLKDIVNIFIHFLYTNNIEIPYYIKPTRFLFDIILDLADFLHISKYDMLHLLDEISALQNDFFEYYILRNFVRQVKFCSFDRDFIDLSKVSDEDLPFILDRVIELSKKCYGLIADKHETLCEKIKNIRIKKGISYKSEDSDLYESDYSEDSDSCSYEYYTSGSN